MIEKSMLPLRTLRNRHSVFPFDCSANCWGAGNASVYLKADRSNYARSPSHSASVRRDIVLSRRGRTAHGNISYHRINLPPSFFTLFARAIVSKGIPTTGRCRKPRIGSGGASRRLVSTESSDGVTQTHVKLSLSPSTTLVRPVGRGRKG